MKTSSPTNLKNIGLLVLSAIDVLTGILSLIFTAISVQIIAVLASGATLFKAVKVAVQSEKTAIFVKPVAIYAVRTFTRSEFMKKFFEKLKSNIKNNKVTLIASFIELVVCGVLGYSLLSYLPKFSWAVGWKLYLLAFGAATIIYAVLFILTVYLGYDNPIFAAIRKAVKAIGGEKAVNVLNVAEEEVKEALEAAKKEAEKRAEEEARIAAQKARDEEIYAKIVEEENKRKEAEKQAKIAAYKATHPEVR